MLQIHKVKNRRAPKSQNSRFDFQKVPKPQELEQAILRRPELLQSYPDDFGHFKADRRVRRDQQDLHRHGLQALYTIVRLPI